MPHLRNWVVTVLATVFAHHTSGSAQEKTPEAKNVAA